MKRRQKQSFGQKNKAWEFSLAKANGYANAMMPMMNALGYVQYVVIAIAGASRIFQAMDEEPETDDGYVTLVYAAEEGGTLTESAHYTGMWAWKHPHGDGTTTLTKLEGRIVLDHVDFGYVPEKQILHDVTLYAEQGQKIAFVGATGSRKDYHHQFDQSFL